MPCHSLLLELGLIATIEPDGGNEVRTSERRYQSLLRILLDYDLGSTINPECKET